MRSMAYGDISIAEKEEHGGIYRLEKGCETCTYEAARLSVYDVLSAVIENELTETEKTAIKLYWAEKMKIPQIAAAAGVTEKSVRYALRKAYDRIKCIMKYIVLYNEILDGRTVPSGDFTIKIIRSNDGKELVPG